MPRRREHQPESHLRHRVGRGARCVTHRNPLRACVIHIDIIHPDPAAADHAEPSRSGRPVNGRLPHLGGRPDDQCVKLFELLSEFLGRIKLLHHLMAAFEQRLFRGGFDAVRNQNTHKTPFPSCFG